MAIRYDKKLNSEINKVVNNYNAKIRRIEKYVDNYNYLLPQKTTVSSIKQNVYTRGELRRKLNELKTFSQRGMENTIQTKGGYSISKYEYTNLMKETRRVRLNITKRIKYMETEKPQVLGKLQARTFSQMGDTKYLNLLAKQKNITKDFSRLGSEEFERFKTLIYKTGRNMEYMNSLFRDNYVEMLNDLAYFTKYDKQTMILNEKQIDEIKSIKDLKKADQLVKDLKLEIDDKGNVKVNKIEYLKYKLSQIKRDEKFYKFFENETAIKSIIDYYVLTTGKVKKFDPENIRTDVADLYDNLINNIDELIQPYK